MHNALPGEGPRKPTQNFDLAELAAHEAGDNLHSGPSLPRPYLDHPVVQRCGKSLAMSIKRQTVDKMFRRQHQKLLTGDNVPEADRLVFSAGGQSLAVGRERDASDLAGVTP